MSSKAAKLPARPTHLSRCGFVRTGSVLIGSKFRRKKVKWERVNDRVDVRKGCNYGWWIFRIVSMIRLSYIVCVSLIWLLDAVWMKKRYIVLWWVTQVQIHKISYSLPIKNTTRDNLIQWNTVVSNLHTEENSASQRRIRTTTYEWHSQNAPSILRNFIIIFLILILFIYWKLSQNTLQILIQNIVNDKCINCTCLPL